MLKINKPEILKTVNGVRVQAIFEVNGEKDALWYEVEEKYGEYLTTERADGFLIGLLFYGMKHGIDIEVEAPVSKKLYYTINKYLVPLISEIHGYKSIKIHCTDLVSEPLSNNKGVGTGLSCGIDSFSTIVDHLEKECPDSYQITHFTFFNVGSHGSAGGENARNLFRERAENAKEFANAYGKDLIIVDSNISEVLMLSFQTTHTLRSMSAAVILQKLFGTYYYSSTVHAKNFKLSKDDTAYYDIFNLSMLSTESINLFSSCSTKTRVDKTRMVANFPLSYKYLDVCVISKDNCGKCFKCLRTLFTLDLLGEIDKFSSVFDLDAYYSKKHDYISHILANYKSDLFIKEIYDEMLKQNYKIPTDSKISAFNIKVNRNIKSVFVGKGIYTKFKRSLQIVLPKIKKVS